LLSLVGQPDAIKAIRASTTIGLPVELVGIGPLTWLQSKTPLFHVVQKRLASGAQAILWLPLRGTTFGIDAGETAYIIHRGEIPMGPPPSFIHTIDRVLACPILTAWALPLWKAALKHKWVQHLECHNCHVWELTMHEQVIIEWIHRQLIRRKLTVPQAPSSRAAS
jgi:hypothetical protein